MAERRFRLNRKALREIRTSAQVEAFTRAAAERVAAQAGPGFVVVRADLRQERSRFFVAPRTPEAHRANVVDYAVLRGLAAAADEGVTP